MHWKWVWEYFFLSNYLSKVTWLRNIHEKKLSGGNKRSTGGLWGSGESWWTGVIFPPVVKAQMRSGQPPPTVSHSASFWSWSVFCLWNQSSADKAEETGWVRRGSSPFNLKHSSVKISFRQNHHQGSSCKPASPDLDLLWNISSLWPVEKEELERKP